MESRIAEVKLTTGETATISLLWKDEILFDTELRFSYFIDIQSAGASKNQRILLMDSDSSSFLRNGFYVQNTDDNEHLLILEKHWLWIISRSEQSTIPLYFGQEIRSVTFEKDAISVLKENNEVEVFAIDWKNKRCELTNTIELGKQNTLTTKVVPEAKKVPVGKLWEQQNPLEPMTSDAQPMVEKTEVLKSLSK